MNLKIFLLVLGLMSFSFAQQYLLVIDASGSMDDWVPPDNEQTKMEAAKIAAKNFVDNTNDPIGLVVFNDCDSSGDINSGGISLVQDFTTDKASLKSNIDSLTPYWDTPIASALSEARGYLETKGQGTIILITDGEETCGGEPVSIAGQIYDENIGEVHVIGYLIGDSAEETAKSIAQAGGGKYYSVENADQLEAALTEIKNDDLDVCCCPSAMLLVLPFLGIFLSFRGKN